MSVCVKQDGQLVKTAGLYSVSTPIGMADIYSTEEKEVGLWVDNKPLYQKVVIINSLPSSVATVVSYPHGISNVEQICDYEGIINYGNGTVAKIDRFALSDNGTLGVNTSGGFTVNVNKTSINIIVGVDRSAISATFIIKYTKTTDTPWSGKFVPQGYGYVSSGDIYSFEERQVGVFADGKPLYQKTVDCGVLPNNTSVNIVSVSGWNIENLVDLWGACKSSSSLSAFRPMPLASGETNPPNNSIRVDINNSYLRVVTYNDWSGYEGFVTIQYTKTTDIAGSGEYVPSGDKAVHYDDTEQVIGTWFGETLYRKSLKLPSTITCPNNSWVDTGLTIQNVSRVINGEVLRNGTQNFALSINIDNSAVKVQSYYNSTLTLDSNTYITLEYTKTS